MSYRIEAANKAYTGVVAGVALVNGVADGLPSVPDYFRRHHGYTVTGDDETPSTDNTGNGSTRKGATK